ncbi:hypothetical protein PanWU01x14_082730 [Parasponia andersonii]|uniref:Uncharacterized protein n=1 Tax=Parasponia andersonii TaxID=3476 RepID=A0A2P5D9Y5_PARAD|nr:hypothetical protein PanWU01x14_082730 [Parasponia andersonii]
MGLLCGDDDNSIKEVITLNAAMETVQAIGTSIKSVGKQAEAVTKGDSNEAFLRGKESSGIAVEERVEKASVVENEKTSMMTQEESMALGKNF